MAASINSACSCMWQSKYGMKLCLQMVRTISQSIYVLFTCLWVYDVSEANVVVREDT